MEYKKTLFQKSKLGNNIVPVDNGLVDGDVILTTQQARILIDNLKKKTGNKAEGSFRRKRSSLFFELNENFAQKWDISNPIPYTIAEDFNAEEIESVEKGIKMITDAARCIKFKHFEHSKDASKNPYHFMYFAKNENTTACGISDIGRVPDRPNALWLNFEGTGCLPKDMSGVIAHEIMHALGISHMHQRVDREKYLRINWDKIDPQAYSDFIVVDPSIFSTYGVPFAYDSIMLYKWNQGGRGFNTKTMEPLKGYAKNLHIMGQRTELSKSDKEILNKAYCYTIQKRLGYLLYSEKYEFQIRRKVRQLDAEIEDLKENVDFVDKIPEERIINLRILLDKYSIDDLKQWDNILKEYKGPFITLPECPVPDTPYGEAPPCGDEYLPDKPFDMKQENPLIFDFLTSTESF
ncbi:hypothetical protein WR25_24416 [Diploscapter pachys]|uniref:Metalloendopeptidase n=1 Tax=Diploscapter pachys TaxID=2018661 RepID=A0A2A2LIQ1_9BILA|nr:hypothetical protein WR25_24416 [Diploscapter pachys]